MSQTKGFLEGFPKGFLEGFGRTSRKGYRNPDLNNSNATATSNATSTQLNTTQLHHQLKPRRGLEESKAKSFNSRNSNGAPRGFICVWPSTRSLTRNEATA